LSIIYVPINDNLFIPCAGGLTVGIVVRVSIVHCNLENRFRELFEFFSVPICFLAGSKEATPNRITHGGEFPG